MSALWLGAVLWSLGVGWAARGEEASGPAVEDGREGVDALAFRSTVDRWVGRMNEFDMEVRDIVAGSEVDERQKLKDGYSGLLDDLHSEETALRETAIVRLEGFLTRYPSSMHTPHAMFLLGDLYYEENELMYTDEAKAYDRAFAEGRDFDAAGEAPMRDHTRALRMFENIVDAWRDYENADGAWYMLGYIYNRDDTLQADESTSRDAYLTLVDRYPESDFAAAAHMMLGEYYFENHNIDGSIPHYQKVVDLHAPDGAHYEKGLYKLAWAHYKLSSYDQCLTLLAKLLDWSEKNFMRTGKRSAMAPEAIEYTAISFSDVADKSGRRPVDVAQGFYRTVGDRTYEDKVYERLADVLTQQARYAEAIDTYGHMIKRWPSAPKNPTYQWTTASLYMSLTPADRDAAQNAITRLNELFNRDSPWANANRNNPDALNVADGYIEESLAAVAINLHNAATESGDRAKFSRAADLYSQYLNKFPFAQDYYEIQWYFADTLLKSGRVEEASAEYSQLLKGTGHPYRDGSMWNLMQVRRQALIDRYGRVEQLPPDAVVESQVKLPSGADRLVYKISAPHSAFIESADMLVDATFTDEEFSKSLDESRAALLYLPGQIFYYHGHLDQARERLQKVIERHPQKDEAAFAASLIVDSYTEEEDLAKVRMWAGKFAQMRLGSSDEAIAKNLDFSNLEEGAAFKMAAQFITDGNRTAAAEAFLKFMSDFPRSEHIKKAHYNAANSYEIIGQVERANDLFRDYVDRIERGVYQADEQAWPIYERIAHNYASALELDEAVRYFELLYRRSQQAEKPYENDHAALYNAGFLRVGLGDHAGAARNLERYATEHPDQADAESVMFSAGDQWELVGSMSSREFYQRYLEVYGDAQPDHAIQALYRIATIDEEQGSADAQKNWESLTAAYNRLNSTGRVGPAGQHYAAGAAFRPIEAAYRAFQQYEFSTDDAKNADLLLKIKRPELVALEKRGLQLIQDYKDFEYSQASLFVLGSAYLTYANMLFLVPEPQGLDEEQLDMYLTELDNIRIPVEDKGRARLLTSIDKAKKAAKWSEWTTKALALLAEKFPTEFAPDRPEKRGVGDSTLVPMAGPMSPIGAEGPILREGTTPPPGTPAQPATEEQPEGVWQ
jgi:TolA-binding protein